MKLHNSIVALVAALAAIAPASAKDAPVTTGVAASMIVTATVDDGKRMPQLRKEDLSVKRGKDRLPVIDLVPAQGDRAGLDLFILIDDATETGIGSHLADLKKFVNAQPESTMVGVAYARNGTIVVAQDLTNDHARAARAIRLPIGSAGAFGSPYLSVADLVKRWPDSMNRHEVLLITDGIDRAHRERNALLNPDVDSAASAAQRAGAMIHTLYFPGIGHWHRNFFEANNGLNGLAKLSDLTGGETFSLSVQRPVSIVPWLDTLQKAIDNQYLISFEAKPEKKAGLQYISFGTEVPGVDLNAANAVWVPAR